MGDRGEPGGTRRLPDDLGEYLAVERGVWRGDALGMHRIVAVETEDGVEVDEPAALELGHLGVRQPHLSAVGLGELVEATADRDGGAPPQLGDVRIPDDGR